MAAARRSIPVPFSKPDQQPQHEAQHRKNRGKHEQPDQKPVYHPPPPMDLLRLPQPKRECGDMPNLKGEAAAAPQGNQETADHRPGNIPGRPRKMAPRYGTRPPQKEHIANIEQIEYIVLDRKPVR
jgi:hypothetical protein